MSNTINHYRANCPFCNRRVTVGSCGRMYGHKDKFGKFCSRGHLALIKQALNEVEKGSVK